MIDILIMGIVISYLIIASIVDIKEHIIPDWLSYSLIALMLAIRAFYSIATNDIYYFIWGLAGLGAAFVIGGLLYLTRQWGFGDTKLLMGIGIGFATIFQEIPYYFPTSPIIFLMFCILLFGFVYGFIWGLVIFAQHWREAINMLRKLFFYPILIYPFIFVLIVLFILTFFVNDILSLMFRFLLILLIVGYFLFVFAKATEIVGMKKSISLSKVEEGDFLISDIKKNNKILIKKGRLTKKQLDILKRKNIKTILIRMGIPFAPAILGGTILAIIFAYLI